jgi:hypothetical protein
MGRGPNTDLRWPTLYFRGGARGINGMSASIEGAVHMGLDGVVKWQFVSVLVGKMVLREDKLMYH